VKITNANGIPASGVTAVVLNVTVTRTSGNGVLTVWGDNTNRPKTSNLNWTKGETISNLVTVKVPGDGWVDFYTTSATDVIADVQGYYTNDTTGYTFTAHTPKRLLDTRSKIGVSTTTPVSNNLVNVSITGNAGIPTTAKAVVLNVTATQTVGAGYIAAYPSGATRPSVSNINWTASNTTLPGLVIVPVGSNGKVSLYVHGKAHVIADVFGYFSADGALKLNTTTPTRLLDTRANIGISRTTALTAGQTVKLQVAGRAGIPSGVSAVLLNITVTGTTSSGVLTAWPDGISRPSTSNLNWAKGWTVPNLVLVPVGSDGYVDIYVNAPTHVIADVTGYFSGS
jgi:hypothetical protein